MLVSGPWQRQRESVCSRVGLCQADCLPKREVTGGGTTVDQCSGGVQMLESKERTVSGVFWVCLCDLSVNPTAWMCEKMYSEYQDRVFGTKPACEKVTVEDQDVNTGLDHRFANFFLKGQMVNSLL